MSTEWEGVPGSTLPSGSTMFNNNFVNVGLHVSTYIRFDVNQKVDYFHNFFQRKNPIRLLL